MKFKKYLCDWFNVLSTSCENALDEILRMNATEPYNNQSTGNKSSSYPMLTKLYDELWITRGQWGNSSPPGWIVHYFIDDIFRCIFVNEKFCILIKISLKFDPKGPIDNNLAFV